MAHAASADDADSGRRFSRHTRYADAMLLLASPIRRAPSLTTSRRAFVKLGLGLPSSLNTAAYP